MADLTDTQAAQSIKIIGSDASGVETNPAAVNSDQNLQVVQPDKSGNGTITALNGAVTITPSSYSSIFFNITGIWTATISFQAQTGDGTWNSALALVPISTPVASTAGNGFFILPCGGYKQVRIIATAFTSGTATVTWNASVAPNVAQAINFNADALNVRPWTADGSGNSITSTLDSGTSANKRGLDVSVVPPDTNYYSANVAIEQTAATAANATVWTMRNPAASTKTVFLEEIILNMTYDDATPVTRQTPKYVLERFSTATPTAGTAITVIKMNSANAATAVTDVRFLDTGLTTTGVVFEAAFATLGLGSTGGTSSTHFRMDNIAFALAPGEGLAIRLAQATLNGISLCGTIIWREA